MGTNTNMGYDFRCTKCEYEWVFEGSKMEVMDVYDDPCPSCKECGHIERGYVQENREGYPKGIIDPDRLAFRGHSTQHKEMMAKIHESTPGSTLDKKM